MDVEPERFGFLAPVDDLVELRVEQLAVHAVLCKQLLMRALFSNHAVLHDQNLVGFENRRKSMRDDDARPPDHELFKRLLNRMFGNRVERARSFVENQNLRVLQDDARKRQALLLATRKFQAAIAHLGVVAKRLCGDVIVNVGDLARLFDVLKRCVFVRVPQVLEYRAVEQVRLLRDNANLATQVCKVEAAHIDTCNGDAASCHIVEARDEVHDRRFARSARTDDCVHCTTRHLEAHIGQHEPFGVVSESHVIVANRLALDIGLLSILGRDDRVLAIEIVEDAHEQRKRPRERHLQVEYRLNRSVQSIDQRHHGGDSADRQRRIKLLDYQKPTGEVDEQRPELGEHPHRHTEQRPRTRFTHAEVSNFFIHMLEFLVLAILAGEHLDEQRTACRKRLVDDLVHLVGFGLRLRSVLEPRTSGGACGQDEQRQHGHAHDRELPAHGEQRNERRHDGGNVADDLRERAADNRTDTADVGIHARDDVALFLGREERVRHMLQMVVHLVAHVIDDVLRYPSVDVVLEHADELTGHHSRQSDEQQLNEVAQILANKRLINDHSRDDRWHEADHRGNYDCHEHEHELQPIRFEV